MCDKEIRRKKYPLAAKYNDLNKIYTECSGPGGLELAEFIIKKMKIKPGSKILDVGTAHGYQTCFIAKEFDVTVVGIDPMKSFRDDLLQIDHLEKNAREWNVQNKVIGIQVGVPDTKLASCSFDAIYSTTALEMLRGFYGEENYRECLREIYRLLKPNGIFGLGEPMHNDIEIPKELEPIISYSKDCIPWKEAFESLANTEEYIKTAGFDIIESGYAEDAYSWWKEYTQYDPDCIKNPTHEDIQAIETDKGRWVSFGYAICQKK